MLSFLDCQWILLRHLEFKKNTGKKQTLQSVEKLSFSFFFITFLLSYCFLSYIFKFLKYFYTYSVIGKSILDAMNTTLLKFCRTNTFLYQTTHKVTCNYLAWFRHEIQAMYGQVSVLLYHYIHPGLCLLLFYSVHVT